MHTARLVFLLPFASRTTLLPLDFVFLSHFPLQPSNPGVRFTGPASLYVSPRSSVDCFFAVRVSVSRKKGSGEPDGKTRCRRVIRRSGCGRKQLVRVNVETSSRITNHESRHEKGERRSAKSYYDRDCYHSFVGDDSLQPRSTLVRGIAPN